MLVKCQAGDAMALCCGNVLQHVRQIAIVRLCHDFVPDAVCVVIMHNTGAVQE
jgi:hypothetical protein